MGIVTSDDVAALKNKANHGAVLRFFAEVFAARGPVEVFLEVLEHRGGQGVPDTQIGEDLRIGYGKLRAVVPFRCREDVLIRKHQEEVAEVVGCSSQPVLEAEHEAASVLCLLHRQVLQHRGQGVEQLEHGVLEASST